MRDSFVKAGIRCPSCDTLLDGATDCFDDAVPQGGDYSICIGCGIFLIFNEDLSLRLPDVKELAEFRNLPNYKHMLRAQQLIVAHAEDE